MTEFFKQIMPLVNTPEMYTLLKEYANQRIKILMGNLEVQKDHHKILELQGAIAELRRFNTLREEAIESLKNVKE